MTRIPRHKYFGTDGVRGPYGGPVINEPFAARLGEAAGRFVLANGALAGSQVIVGRDTRASGPTLEMVLARGFAAAGLRVASAGVVPTPAVSLAVAEARAALGVAITASHNLAIDNGIKFFGPAGVKLTDEEEAEIERQLPAEPAANVAPVIDPNDAGQRYETKVAALLPPEALSGWKIVLDTANGAGYRTSREVLKKLGAELMLLGNEPDGTNINAGVGSQHPEAMAVAVRASGARLGIAHDGDADRCILCDEAGGILDGDEIFIILALHALKNNKLSSRTLVVTLQSNIGVDAAVRAAGGEVVRSRVGDRYLIERMAACGSALGSEPSGHVICREISPTSDGLVAALKVIEVMLVTGQPLSFLRRHLKKFPQRTAALAVREKLPLEHCAHLTSEIAALESELGTSGRALVRYSGTESKLRLLVEGESEDIVSAALLRLETAARVDLPLS